jgi:hypothetical protein
MPQYIPTQNNNNKKGNSGEVSVLEIGSNWNISKWKYG